MRFLTVLFLLVALPAQAEVTSINVNRACASSVGIAYASDNFSEGQWRQFQECREYLKQFAEGEEVR